MTKKGLLLILVLLSVSFAGYSQRDIKNIDREIERQKELLESVKNKEKNALRNLYVVNRALRKLKSDLKRTQQNLSVKKNQVYQTNRLLNDLKREYSDHKHVLEKRVEEIYKDQSLGYLSFLVNTDSFYDFLSSSYYFEKIVKDDFNSLNRLKEAMKQYEHKNAVLTQQKRQAERLKRSISNKKKLYAAKSIDQKRTYNSLKGQRIDYEKRIAELEKNSKEIAAMIRKLSSGGELKGSGSGSFEWPLRGVITSPYGNRRHPIFKTVRFHSGIDIAKKFGSKIVASDGGVVIFSGWWGGYGKAVIIDHGRGYTTVYGHMSRIRVKKGQKVSKRQVIGLVGTTGYSTGPHLHFEIRINGKTLNPKKFLK